MKRIFFIVLTIIIGIVVVSCDKENEQIGNSNTTNNLQLKDGDSTGYYTDSTYITSEGLIYTYFKDGIKRRMIEFRPRLEDENGIISNQDLYIFIRSLYDAQDNLIGLQVNEFTLYSDFINYGNSISSTFGNMMQFRNDVVSYVDQNNIVNQYETTGEIPVTFQPWYDTQIQTYFPNGSKIYQPVNIHTEYNNGGDDRSWVHLYGYAYFMVPGFNNQVSRYQLWGFIAPVSIFDKTFYRNHLATIWSIGETWYRFQGPLLFLNDKMSSFFS